MPTYVYECSRCEKVTEVDQRITDDPLTDCDCGPKGTLRRIIQPTAVMFKGSGFYVNDTAGKPETPKPTACDQTGSCPSCAPTTTESNPT